MLNSKNKSSMFDKASTILPIMEGRTFWFHNGNKFRSVLVKPFMFGRKFGEYVETKMRCVYKRRKNKRKKR